MAESAAPPSRPPRYVFVAGLHRSGTSLVSRLLGAHPDVSVIRGSGAPEDEGAYLQGAIPHTARSGLPGAFAFDPAQHLAEGGAYDTLEVRQRIRLDWDPWFDSSAPWRLEKSPVNLLRTRLYQQLFPMAHFVLIIRHPLAVARATAKWSGAGEDRLVAHWAAAHEIALDDVDRLHNAVILRYEDLCRDPAAAISGLQAFLDLDPAPAPGAGVLRAANADYPGPSAVALPAVAGRLGYGPDPCRCLPLRGIEQVRHALRSTRETAAARFAGR